MASFLLNRTRQRKCYFCHQVSANDAYSTSVCLRHQALISLRLLVLLARHGRFARIWKVVRVKW